MCAERISIKSIDRISIFVSIAFKSKYVASVEFWPKTHFSVDISFGQIACRILFTLSFYYARSFCVDQILVHVDQSIHETQVENL